MAPTKLLVSDLASVVDNVPSHYIQPVSDRPNLTDVHVSDASIPLIDLHQLSGPGRSHVIERIGLACQQDGFFQVKNHGIHEEKIRNMLNLAREFFKLPESERLKNYSDDPSKTTRLSTSFNVKTEKVANWRDFLRLHCFPLKDYVHEWLSNPPSFREDVAEYCTSVRGLVLRLLEAISESLGLQRDDIDNTLNKHGQHMALNYYPPCPQPELTYGLPGHTDPNVITILLQDDVPRLQVLKNGKWVAVKPIPIRYVREANHILIVGRSDQEGPVKKARTTSEDIVFTKEDASEVCWPHNDALVIRARINNVEVLRIMVDTGSFVNVMYKECYDQLGLGANQLKPYPKPLYGFTGDAVIPIGQVRLPLSIGDPARQATILADFLIINGPSMYDVILGRPAMNDLNMIVSTKALIIKFPTPSGVGFVRGERYTARHCY